MNSPEESVLLCGGLCEAPGGVCWGVSVLFLYSTLRRLPSPGTALVLSAIGSSFCRCLMIGPGLRHPISHLLEFQLMSSQFSG